MKVPPIARASVRLRQLEAAIRRAKGVPSRIIWPRACDDWYDDEPVWLTMGHAESNGDTGHRYRSVSPAAHRAMNAQTAPVIGFHKPRPRQ